MITICGKRKFLNLASKKKIHELIFNFLSPDKAALESLLKNGKQIDPDGVAYHDYEILSYKYEEFIRKADNIIEEEIARTQEKS